MSFLICGSNRITVVLLLESSNRWSFYTFNEHIREDGVRIRLGSGGIGLLRRLRKEKNKVIKKQNPEA